MENQENGNPQVTENDTIAESLSCIEKSQDQQLVCWLYVSRSSYGADQQDLSRNTGLPRATLEDAIHAIDPVGAWNLSETHCGLIAGFARESDADKLLQRRDLARIFDVPVQVARFCDRDARYRQAVLLRDVPWAIPLQDLNSALTRQGITTGSVERLRHYVRVEILDAIQYEQLLRQGLNFFGAARFNAVPERWWRNGPTTTAAAAASAAVQNPFGCNPGNANQIFEAGPNHQQQHQQQQIQQSTEDVLQCYRCQGFWHVAANCRHLPRCVRCGEPHSVEFCARPRNNPICCHCSGPHHAGYRQCPVRLQLLNATPVSLTLSTSRLNSPTSQIMSSCGKSSSNSNAPTPAQSPK